MRTPPGSRDARTGRVSGFQSEAQGEKSWRLARGPATLSTAPAAARRPDDRDATLFLKLSFSARTNCHSRFARSLHHWLAARPAAGARNRLRPLTAHLARGNAGRPVGGKPQPKPYSAPPAPGHRASSAIASSVTRRSLPGHRAQPHQIGSCQLQLKMQPQIAGAITDDHRPKST